MQVWDKVAQKSCVHHLQDMRGTYTHACAFLVYILNLYCEDTCVVQVETGDLDTGFAAMEMRARGGYSRGLSGFSPEGEYSVSTGV